MERMMSVEDKIRRAEEIYNRRRESDSRYSNSSTRVSVNSRKDFKLFKKLIWQIIICLLIYSTFYFCIINNYVFSEDLKNKVREILSYDVNFQETYTKLYNIYINWTKESKIQNDNLTSNQEENLIEQENQKNGEQNKTDLEESDKEKSDNSIDVQNTEETSKEENIGGAVEENNENVESTITLSQEEQDILDVKNTTSFIVPVEGYISSKFGIRNPTTSTVPKNHTGLDIAAISGTIIRSATDGVVIQNSSQGDYGNHLKIKIGDVTMVYAHCKTLYVNEGENVTQGQRIAEVGTTGNSTGPHLHFEIRKADRFVDPQKIINI